MIYHCRNYTEIKGDPLFDPNRHARVGVVKWTADGPDFGVPEPDNLWTPTTTDVLPADGGPLAGTPAVGTEGRGRRVTPSITPSIKLAVVVGVLPFVQR